MLRQFRAHEEPAVARAKYPQMFRRRVLLRDEVLTRGEEIVENILLVRERALLMPLLTVLAAAPQIRRDVHTAGIQPQLRRGAEEARRFDAPVTAVADQHDRIRAVELRILAANDVQGNARSILRRRELTHDLRAGEFHRTRLDELRVACLSGLLVIEREIPGPQEGLDLIHHGIRADRLELRDGPRVRQRQHALRVTREIVDRDTRWPARNSAHVDVA